MQTVAVVRLSPPSALPTATGNDFWTNYWQLNGDRRSRDAADSERAVLQSFGPILAQMLSNSGEGWNVEVQTRGIRYGSIELLIALIGGEELLSEMFWTVLEFYAPQAFNLAVGGTVPMQTHVTHGQGGGHGGGGGGTGHGAGGAGYGPNRLLAATATPQIAIILVFVVIAGLLGWWAESLEKENIELHHDFTRLVDDLANRESVLATGILLRLGLEQALKEHDHEREQKADAPPPAATPHDAQTQPTPASSTRSPALEPPTTKVDPAHPTQVLPPSAEPKKNEASPKVESSPQDEKKREESH